MNIATYTSYGAVADFELLAENFEFSNEVWKVASSISRHPVTTKYTEILSANHLNEADFKIAITELLSRGLIYQNVISWEQFNALSDELKSSSLEEDSISSLIATDESPTESVVDKLSKSEDASLSLDSILNLEDEDAAPEPEEANAEDVEQADSVVEGSLDELTISEPEIPVSEPCLLIQEEVMASIDVDSGVLENADVIVEDSPLVDDYEPIESGAGIGVRMGSFTAMADSPEVTKAWIYGRSVMISDQAASPVGGVGVGHISVPESAEAVEQSLLTGNDEKAYRLRPLLVQIEKLCGGGIEGDLLVYQVFLRIPIELLREEGISSLHIVNHETSFNSRKLLDAIVTATREVTGHTLQY